MTHSRQAIRALLDGIGTAPRRGLGQNFVADPNTVRRIARLAGVGPGDRVVEIGAGLGSLTLALAETGAHVTAVEVDPRIAGALRTVLSDAASSPSTPNVTVVEADAMTLDWPAVLGGGDHWTLVANLPYNVATPLVCDLLDDGAGDRTDARHGAARGGRAVRRRSGVEAVRSGEREDRLLGVGPSRRRRAAVGLRSPTQRRVGAGRDHPPPSRPTTDPTELFSLVRTAFGQRRKMLRRSLAERVTPAAVRGRRDLARGTARATRRRRLVPPHAKRCRA